MLCSPYGSSIRSHVSHKTIQTNSLPFFLPFCWHKLRWENMLLGLKITTTTTQSHQLNNMSNVWVKIHCDGDGKQQHSFQPSQGCQPGGLHLSQAHRIWGGLFWGDINTGISPASVAKTQSQAGTAQPRTTWTHNLYLRHALLACLHLHWLHFDGSSSIPRVQLKGQGTENPFAYATCFEPAKPGGDGSALQLLEATLSSGGLF